MDVSCVCSENEKKKKVADLAKTKIVESRTLKKFSTTTICFKGFKSSRRCFPDNRKYSVFI